MQSNNAIKKTKKKTKVIDFEPDKVYCKKCGKLLNDLDNIHEHICHSCKVQELSERHPNVPTEIYDIEASDEIAMAWYDYNGY